MACMKKTLRQSVMLTLCLQAGFAFSAPAYLVKDLGSPAGASSWAAGINDRGDVTGASQITPGGQYRAFVYSNGSFQFLETLAGWSMGSAINNLGEVVGASEGVDGKLHAVVYLKGNPIDLGIGSAYGINDSGDIVGQTETAFLHRNGTLFDLGSLGGTHSVAYAINNSGEIVGASLMPNNSPARAFIYSNDSMVNLGTLWSGGSSYAMAINDNSVVAGYYATANNHNAHAFIHNGQTMFDIGTLGGNQSSAYAINNLGWVVGRSSIEGNLIEHGFLFANNTMYDLNDLLDSSSGWEITGAYGINENGDIAANGCRLGVGCRAVILENVKNSVPEPSTASLFFSVFFLGFFPFRKSC